MLDIRALTVRYTGGRTCTDAVRGISFMLERGSFTGLVGGSGSGKSTMIMAALGLLPKGTSVSGEIRFNDKNILALKEDGLQKIRWKEIALVPQGALNSFTPVLTIGHHIEEVLRVHMSMEGPEAAEKIGALLEEVGLDVSIRKRYPHELSGGQKQRAAIALALSCSPSLLFADEPTTALDVITQAEILKLLLKLREDKGLTVFFVTHDLPLAATVCDRLLVMKDGLLVEDGTPDDIITDPKHSHTRDLVRAMLT